MSAFINGQLSFGSKEFLLHFFFFPPPLSVAFEERSPVAQAGLKLVIQLRLVLLLCDGANRYEPSHLVTIVLFF